MYKGNICMFLFLLFFSSPFAQKVTISPQPGWLHQVKIDPKRKPLAKDINNGYYLELVDRQIDLFSKTYYTHIVRQIVNETGVQNASEVSVSFAPDYQRVIFHKLALVRDGKVMNEVKLSQIKIVQEENEASQFQYNGEKRAFITLQDVRKGDKIDASYSVVGFNPVFADKFSDEIYFYSGVAVGNLFETLIVPANRKLNFKYFNNVSAPQKFTKGDTVIYNWSNPFMKNYEEQVNVPDWYNNYPFVSVTEFKTWKDVAVWGTNLFNNYNYTLSSGLKNKIETLYREAKGDNTKYIELAARFVQDQVRYLGMEIGTYTHQPHDPSKTFSLLYGDCKDKALLLAVMLREKRILAFAALTNTATKAELINQDPSPVKFNHVIVAFNNNARLQFIDATIAYQRGKLGELFIPAYGNALILNTETDALSTITPLKNKETTILEKFYVKRKTEGDSYLEVLTDYVGGAADKNRSMLAGYSISELEETYRKFYAKYYDSVRIAEDINITDDEENNNVHIYESYLVPGIWTTDKKGKDVIGTFAHAISDQLPNPNTSYKKGPLTLLFPQKVHHMIELHMPSTWTFPDDDYHISNASYQFDFKIIRQDSIITLDYTFETFRDFIPFEEIGKYKEDYTKMTGLLEYSLSDGNTTVAAESGNIDFNWRTALFALLLLTGFFLLFKRLDKGQAGVDIGFITARSLGGWVIVLGIGLIFGIISHAANLITNNVFSKSVWDYLGATGGGKLQWLLLLEETVTLTMLSASTAVFYWFLRRRDIFPKMFISLILLNIACNLILLLFYNTMTLPAYLSDIGSDGYTTIGRLVVYALIWIPYLNRSERVKNTFVIPYGYSGTTNIEEEIKDDINDTDSNTQLAVEPPVE